MCPSLPYVPGRRAALRAARAVGVPALAAIVVIGAQAAAPVRAADSLPPAPAPAVLAPAEGAAAPTPEGIAEAIGGLVRGGLAGAGVLVIDPGSGRALFQQRGSRPLVPASTVKLATAAAALTVLGPTTTLPTVVRREDRTLYLVGGGDPTLERSGRGASLRALARASVEGLTAGTRVRLVFDDSLFSGPALGPGWPRSFPRAGVVAPITALMVDGGRVRPGAEARVADPARQAAEVFAGYLRSHGLAVVAVQRGRAPQDAPEVARVESRPVVDIVEGMLTESENTQAEMLGHLVGQVALGDGSFLGGARATQEALAELGLDTTGLELVDGSGLSGRNRATARLLADLLVDVTQDPDLAPIAPGLAVAGLTGTLADRFGTALTRAGRGVVRAKTGTLTGVVALAGTVLDREGRVLVFALVANGVRSIPGTRDIMDRVASVLATCGCRP